MQCMITYQPKSFSGVDPGWIECCHVIVLCMPTCSGIATAPPCTHIRIQFHIYPSYDLLFSSFLLLNHYVLQITPRTRTHTHLIWMEASFFLFANSKYMYRRSNMHATYPYHYEHHRKTKPVPRSCKHSTFSLRASPKYYAGGTS